MTEQAVPATTLAILLGASEFPKAGLTSSPSFLHSARDFATCLLDERYFGLPRANLLDRFDSEQSADPLDEEISEFLRTRQAQARVAGQPITDLLVYYVGHGDFSANAGEYFLTLRNTRRESLDITGYPADVLARTLTMEAAGLRRYLILDCCFSAAAYKSFQSGPLEVSRQLLLERLPKRGTALMCASSAHAPALAPEGLRHTMFTGALLDVLRQGDAESLAFLSLSRVGQLVERRIRSVHGDAAVRPEVHSPDQADGDVAVVDLFRNVALGPSKAEARAAPAPAAKARTEGVSSPPPVVAAVEPPSSTAPNVPARDVTSLDTVVAFEEALRLERAALHGDPTSQQLSKLSRQALRQLLLGCALLALVLPAVLVAPPVLLYLSGHDRALTGLVAVADLLLVLLLARLSYRRLVVSGANGLRGAQARLQLLASVRRRRALKTVAELARGFSAADVNSRFQAFVLAANEALNDEKRRVASVIADQKRAERELAQIEGQRAEWQRRVELAIRAGDPGLAAEAETRARERAEEARSVGDEHARLLRLCNAEKQRLRALNSHAEAMQRHGRYMRSEVERAGRTRAAERAALTFLRAALGWQVALDEPIEEVD